MTVETQEILKQGQVYYYQETTNQQQIQQQISHNQNNDQFTNNYDQNSWNWSNSRVFNKRIEVNYSSLPLFIYKYYFNESFLFWTNFLA